LKPEFYFYGGSRSYSEYTPPNEAAIACNKGHYNHDPFWPEDWDVDLPMTRSYLPNDQKAAAAIKTAETCADYELDSSIDLEKAY
jgi:hypothetical protein